jgi:hypothetical protein
MLIVHYWPVSKQECTLSGLRAPAYNVIGATRRFFILPM